MATENPHNSGGKQGRWRCFLDVLWAADAAVSSAVFEAWALVKRGWAAYASWLERFRVRGLRRLVVDLADNAMTLAIVFLFGIIAYALPIFPADDDAWNARRQVAVTITDSNGELLGWRGIRQDDTIPLEELSPYLVKAVLATEDARFYEHFGVDVIGTLRAAVANARAKGVVQGGSTLTQQLAKNLFLSSERSLRRKIHEAFYALWIEARLSKDEILKMYLDRSYLGAGNYGVEAAAQFYFGKSARDMNLKEAAMIAGLFKAPSSYAPHRQPEAAERRAMVVLHRMLQAGFISYGELLEARKQQVQIVGGQDIEAPQHFLDLVYKETLDIMKRKGLTAYSVEVKSSIDMRLQRLAEKAVKEALEKHGRAYHASQGALVAVSPDGALRALVGGRDYEKSQFNRATDAWRQPGSSFKPFVYLTALLRGMTPRTVVTDAPLTIRGWTPQNYSRRYHGRVTLMQALTHSYNTVPVRLMLKVGAKNIIRTARLAGLDAPLRPVPSLPLGSNEVTVLDITGAYAAFANGGYKAQPWSVMEIRRPDGTLLYSRANDPEAKLAHVFPEKKIAQLNQMLANVVKNGTARRANLEFTPQAGKTGTTSGYRDAWFIGFTGHLVTGIWFGNDDYSPTRKMTGGSVPAMTWKAFMEKALAGLPPKPLPGVPLSRAQKEVAARMADKTEQGLAQARGTGPGTEAAGKGEKEAQSISLALLPSISELDDADILVAAPAAALAAKSSARVIGPQGTKPQGTEPKAKRGRGSPMDKILRIFGARRGASSAAARRRPSRPRARTNFSGGRPSGRVRVIRAGRGGAKKRRRIKFLNIFR